MDRKGLNQSKRGKGLIKGPAGLGLTLAGACFSCSRTGHLGLPPATALLFTCPQNSTAAHSSQIQTIPTPALCLASTGLRETPTPVRPMRSLGRAPPTHFPLTLCSSHVVLCGWKLSCTQDQPAPIQGLHLNPIDRRGLPSCSPSTLSPDRPARGGEGRLGQRPWRVCSVNDPRLALVGSDSPEGPSRSRGPFRDLHEGPEVCPGQ